MQKKIVAVEAEAGPVTVVLRDARETAPRLEVRRGDVGLARHAGLAARYAARRGPCDAARGDWPTRQQFGEAKVDETMAAFAKGQVP